MKIIKDKAIFAVLALTLTIAGFYSASAQNKSNFEVLSDKEAAVVIPTNFYFAGQSAPTQMRNAAAARLAKGRLIVVGLVDTSGYSTEISGKYEGFFITDSPIKIGNRNLGTGAYGFGFSKDGRFNIFDLSSNGILSTSAQNDTEMKRPRPLQMTADAKGVRFYKGKSYVLISPR